jgi:hypothetical protein
LSTSKSISPAKITDPDDENSDEESEELVIRPSKQQPKQLYVADKPREVDPAQMQVRDFFSK